MRLRLTRASSEACRRRGRVKRRACTPPWQESKKRCCAESSKDFSSRWSPKRGAKSGVGPEVSLRNVRSWRGTSRSLAINCYVFDSVASLLPVPPQDIRCSHPASLHGSRQGWARRPPAQSALAPHPKGGCLPPRTPVLRCCHPLWAEHLRKHALWQATPILYKVASIAPNSRLVRH